MTMQQPDKAARPRGALMPGAAAAFFLSTASAAALGGAMALPALQALSAIAAAPWLRPRAIARASWIFVSLLVLFVAWAALTILWAAAATAPAQAGRLAGATLVGLIFVHAASRNEAARRMARSFGGAAALTLAAVLLVEAFAGMPLNRLGQPDETVMTTLMRNPARGASVLMLCAWPVIAALAGGGPMQRFAWRALLLMTGVVAFQFDMNAHVVGFAFAAIAYFLGYLAPRFTVGALTLGGVAWLWAAPFALPALLASAPLANAPESWRVRAEIWRFACARIQDNPVLGSGIDASRLHGDYVRVGDLGFRQVPLHPHNASLQIWWETGAIGAGLLGLALLFGGLTLARRVRHARPVGAACAATIATALILANVSYGAWQEWLIASLFMAASLCAAVWRDEGQT